MSEFGKSLKYWRQLRGLSQIELGLQASISAKHISFLETGRSKPSREMVIVLVNALKIPVHDRNILLNYAGYSEEYGRMQISLPEMEPVRRALHLILESHEPYPAIIMDWEWNILMTNQAHCRLIEHIVKNTETLPKTTNMLELIFDPNGFRPYIENWEETAYFLLQRLHYENILYQNRQSTLLAKLRQFPGVPPFGMPTSTRHTEPMASIVLIHGDERLKLFSTLASFGTAVDITMQELIIEQYFPADEETREWLEKL